MENIINLFKFKLRNYEDKLDNDSIYDKMNEIIKKNKNILVNSDFSRNLYNYVVSHNKINQSYLYITNYTNIFIDKIIDYNKPLDDSIESFNTIHHLVTYDLFIYHHMKYCLTKSEIEYSNMIEEFAIEQIKKFNSINNEINLNKIITLSDFNKIKQIPIDNKLISGGNPEHDKINKFLIYFRLVADEILKSLYNKNFPTTKFIIMFVKSYSSYDELYNNIVYDINTYYTEHTGLLMMPIELKKILVKILN